VIVSMGTTGTICASKIVPQEDRGGYYYSKNFISCWGRCGDGMCDIHQDFISGIADVSVGSTHVCAIKVIEAETYKLGCWGNDIYGQSSIPARLEWNIRSVIASDSSTCGVLLNFYLSCWGRDTYIPNKIK